MAAASGGVSLALLGDVMIGRLVNARLRGADPGSVWGDLPPRLAAFDWRFCNLECVVSDVEPSRLEPKAFHFRSDGANVAVLKAAGIDAVSCANNHSLDYGKDALLDMLARLDAAGIAHAGAGAGLAQAREPALSNAGGLRLATLACTDNEPRWAAGPRSPGVWFVPPEPASDAGRDLLDRVAAARRDADVVLVSYHWGSNWGRQPERGHLEMGRALVEAGASAVFGHSCHVFRGVAVHRRAPIVLSAGDFLDDYAVDPVERNDRSFLHALDLGAGALRLVPVAIDDCFVRVARADEAGVMLPLMRELCAGLGTPAHQEGGELVIDLAGAA